MKQSNSLLVIGLFFGVTCSSCIKSALSSLYSNSANNNNSNGVYSNYDPGTVSTLAGNGTQGMINGPASQAEFNGPDGVAVDGAGNVYVLELENYDIRKISSTGQVSTFAGNGNQGWVDGPDSVAEFESPNSLAIDSKGNLYVSEGMGGDDNRIRKIAPDGTVSTIAGSGTFGFKDGPASTAQFFQPEGLTVDAEGNIYVADTYNNRIRKISAAGIVSTVAGDGNQGTKDGTGTGAEFNTPYGVTVDAGGNLYVADYGSGLIRKITSGGVVSTLAGSSTSGTMNGTGASAQFVTPLSVAVDLNGLVYETEGVNNASIRRISPTGVVTALAGSVSSGFMDGATNVALFCNPNALAADSKGNVYVSDNCNARIRKITVK